MSSSEIDLESMVYGPIAEDIEIKRMEAVAKAFLASVPEKQLWRYALVTPSLSAMALFSTFRYEKESDGVHAAIELMRPKSPHDTRSRLVVDRNNNLICHDASNKKAIMQVAPIADELIDSKCVDIRHLAVLGHMGYLAFCESRNLPLNDKARVTIPALEGIAPSRPVGDVIREIIDPRVVPRLDLRTFTRDLDSSHKLTISETRITSCTANGFGVPLLSIDYVDLDENEAHHFKRTLDNKTTYATTPPNTQKMFLPPDHNMVNTYFAPRASNVEMMTGVLIGAALEFGVNLSSVDTQ